jgi:hypothetical protein
LFLYKQSEYRAELTNMSNAPSTQFEFPEVTKITTTSEELAPATPRSTSTTPGFIEGETDTDELSAEPLELTLPYVRLKKKIKIFSLLSSVLMVLGAFGALFLLHTTVWLVSTGARTAIGPENWFSSGGCGMDLTMIAICFIQVVCYVVLEICFVIMFFAFRVRDTWHITKELIFIVGIYFVGSLIFAILNLIPYYANVIEFIVPSGWMVPLVCMIDTIVTAFVPSLLSFRKGDNYLLLNDDHEETKGHNANELLMILQKSELKDTLKLFAVQSFCPEGILCWEDVQKYKKLRSRRARAVKMREILNKYLVSGAPLELNLPNKKAFYKIADDALGLYMMWKQRNVQTKLNEKLEQIANIEDNNTLMSEGVTVDALDKLEKQIIADMMDVFYRYRRTPVGRRSIVTVNPDAYKEN